MKLSLVVLSEGRLEGKTVPISRSPFLIGRDRVCQLRPASPLISNRHCTLSVRAGRAYVRDLGSTNGTKVNGIGIEKGADMELLNQDRLEIGPLAFEIRIESRQALPALANDPTTAVDEEDAATILLDETSADAQPRASLTFDEDGVAQGKTPAVPLPPLPAQPGKPSTEQADTSSAAKNILYKMRTNRKMSAKSQ